MHLSAPLATALLSSSALAVTIPSATTNPVASTRTFTDPTVSLSTDTVVPGNAMYKFVDTSSFKSGPVLKVDGSFICNAQDEARLTFNGFNGNLGSDTMIMSPGDLELVLNGEFINSENSLFQASAASRLRVTVTAPARSVVNQGEILLKGDHISMSCPGTVFNNGDISFDSKGTALYSFGTIINYSTIHMLAASSDSLLEFQVLHNEGRFLYHYGAGKNDAVYVRRRIGNLGTIEFYGWSDDGEIVQNGEIENTGLICLQHSFLRQRKDISGNGFLHLAKSASVEIDGLKKLDPEQKLVLGDAKAYIVLKLISLIKKTYILHGVRDGATFIQSRGNIETMTYEPGNGILFIVQDGREINFQIGEYYTPDGFKLENNRISYHGRTPKAATQVPAECKCSA